MERALQLAAHGLWTTMPNPRVGCVIVRDGIVVGEGWHERAGEPHAEVHALRAAGDRARGAIVYVTLEPCNHTGRTPPCSHALVEAGVGKVVVAMQDPNPLVAGRGLEHLRRAGIQVESGLCEQEAREMNVGFVSRMTRKRPWVRSKVAMSLDGRTALANGTSQWITGPEARTDAHAWRARSCALLTGAGTVLADDPSLTVRHVPSPRQPVRLVLDPRLEVPLSSRVFSGEARTVLLTSEAMAGKGAASFREAAVEVVAFPGDEAGHVGFGPLLEWMGTQGWNEVMVEAGSRLNGALLQGGWLDEWIFYLAPTLLGEGGMGVARIMSPLTRMSQRFDLSLKAVTPVGRDWCFRALPFSEE